ncbi:outer membrane protein assembly factor BamC [Pandoraea nosoerga]|uniref:Outer membrane protein assembly factor BamC n=1 Tax=Pandoraea nosoerga TaxID=2508296 RepID=A0A5E4TQ75_9BURK|nr:outer membrane protein assembly factor BamC [Pandoraea nosoerga]MBN4664933.1 outer membrane protein assembly factor BamC [Pandoraea nosoerga]MBN4675351.1 outer membrane protein assembly factor BamC [Pandoraea nosoerga]MBN4680676.1 outer membrane protein assembly factor BamC [Pandoraea nosoerga]MBN4745862.1 outer membrane protein assembly factor BamC [Pandoraea nosoerga]VVD90106.1 Outer membrane protein assembly factor BamC [Pandoraea nosoerga]
MKRIVSNSVARPVLAWAAIASLALVAGCSSLSSALSSDKVDYKSAKSGPSLDVPPDLTNVQAADRKYVTPGGTATLSTYENQQKVVAANPTDNVLPSVPGMKVVRDGNERWLVIQKAPGDLWPTLREFWQENGFVLTIDSADTGVMETDWAENRAKLNQDIIRDLLGKVLDGLYSTGERDRFRTRVERDPNGGTDIYITHRRMVEVFTNSQKDTTKWEPAPNDPGLEAIMLTKLMQRFGAQAEQAKAQVENAKSGGPTAQVVKTADAAYLDINEPFDRAWRRVGVALDRGNFTVDDRDRAKGLYFVSYVDPSSLAKDNGFFYSLFHAKEVQDSKKAKKYSVNVQGRGESQTRVQVLDDKGNVDNSQIAQTIISVISNQLR